MNTVAWLIIAVVMFVFEAITVGLVCIWFSFGALGAFLISLLTDNIIIQLLVFIAVSAISFIVVKPAFKKLMPKSDNTNSTNRLIGKSGKVIEEINENMGRIQIGDVSWLAKSSDESIIPIGSMVRVKDAISNTLIVEKK